MEDSYISNIQDDDQILDSEMIENMHKMETENENLKNQLSESEQKILDLEHEIETMKIEISTQNSVRQGQEKLINFYKSSKTESESKLKKEFNESLKALKESINAKDKKLLQLSQGLKEQISKNENLMEKLSNKEELIKSIQDEGNENNTNIINNYEKFETKIEQLKESIDIMKEEKEDLISKYEEKLEDINKENNEYQERIYELENDIKDLNNQLDIEKMKSEENPDFTEIENAYKEQLENIKNEFKEEKDKLKLIKEKAKEQRESDMKEIFDLEKNLEEIKEEMSSIKRDKNDIELEKKNLEEKYILLVSKNKELENLIGEQNDKDKNYKLILDKKNIEIENVISKCQEFKENLDLYEKDISDLKLEIDEKNLKNENLLKELEGLKNIIDIKDKENNELKNQINSKKELEAQNEYLKGIMECYKKNIEDLKEQKNKEKKDFEKKIEKLDIELGNCKCQIAAIQYEADRKIINYKNYVKKLQVKLESLGFKFKDKNKKSYFKANTMV